MLKSVLQFAGPTFAEAKGGEVEEQEPRCAMVTGSLTVHFSEKVVVVLLFNPLFSCKSLSRAVNGDHPSPDRDVCIYSGKNLKF